jgi:SAM-dependent methyltransferase
MPTPYDFVVRETRRHLTDASTSLDIGCGGKQYRRFLPGRYIGLDLPSSPYLVEPPELAGSAEAIELPDRSIDLVFGVGVFYMIADVRAAFRECRRVLKPGGRLLIFDYQKQELDRLWDAKREPKHRWVFADLHHILCDAGFVASAVRDVTPVVWRGQGIIGEAKTVLYRVGLIHGTWLVVEAAA